MGIARSQVTCFVPQSSMFNASPQRKGAVRYRCGSVDDTSDWRTSSGMTAPGWYTASLCMMWNAADARRLGNKVATFLHPPASSSRAGNSCSPHGIALSESLMVEYDVTPSTGRSRQERMPTVRVSDTLPYSFTRGIPPNTDATCRAIFLFSGEIGESLWLMIKAQGRRRSCLRRSD